MTMTCDSSNKTVIQEIALFPCLYSVHDKSTRVEACYVSIYTWSNNESHAVQEVTTTSTLESMTIA